jgi:hypothetical protein
MQSKSTHENYTLCGHTKSTLAIKAGGDCVAAAPQSPVITKRQLAGGVRSPA